MKGSMRQDIRLKDHAEFLGYEVKCSHKGYWVPGVPHDPYTFAKGPVHIWQCIHADSVMWMVATLTETPKGTKYTGHKPFQSLLEALNYGLSQPSN